MSDRTSQVLIVHLSRLSLKFAAMALATTSAAAFALATAIAFAATFSATTAAFVIAFVGEQSSSQVPNAPGKASSASTDQILLDGENENLFAIIMFMRRAVTFFGTY